MSKTPEEMAEEYVKAEWDRSAKGVCLEYCRWDFLAGYKAAQDKVMNSSNNSNGWVSVKDRLPEEDVWVLGYYLIYENNIYDVGVVKRFVHTWAEANIWLTNHKNGPLTYEEVDSITHWQPLPAPPKEDK